MAYMRRALRMTGPSNANRSSSRFSNAASVSVRESRNAEHVATRSSSSRYTAKARSGNIYRKLGIHTREELLDLVERKSSPRAPERKRPAAEGSQGVVGSHVSWRG